MRRKGAEMCWMCDHPEATAEEYLDAADFDEGRGTQPVLGMRATRRSA